MTARRRRERGDGAEGAEDTMDARDTPDVTDADPAEDGAAVEDGAHPAGGEDGDPAEGVRDAAEDDAAESVEAAQTASGEARKTTGTPSDTPSDTLSDEATDGEDGEAPGKATAKAPATAEAPGKAAGRAAGTAAGKASGTASGKAARPRRAPKRTAAEDASRPSGADTPAAAPVPRGGGPAARTGRLIVAVLGLIVVTIGAAIAVLATRLTAPERFDETAAREGLQVAPGYVERVISYDYRTLEKDVRDARRNLTGTFLGEYDRSMAKVTPTLVNQQAIQEAKVVKAGVQEATADEVSVLIFSQRLTTKLDRKEPLVYQDRILVTLTKVGDRWLISRMRYLV